MYSQENTSIFQVGINNYADYIQLIQGLLKVTPSQQKMIVEARSIMEELQVDYISSEVRKRLGNEMGVRNINQYIKRLKDKDLIVEVDGRLQFISLLSYNKYGITFIFNE